MEQITLVLDNVRSSHNVGAIMRSATAFGVKYLVCLGITPFPKIKDDPRLPHHRNRTHSQIAKTALGAEKVLTTYHFLDFEVFKQQYHHPVYVLEQSNGSTNLHRFKPKPPFALVLGHETKGVSRKIVSKSDKCIEIAHTSQKESLNVASACSIALYDFYTKLNY